MILVIFMCFVSFNKKYQNHNYHYVLSIQQNSNFVKMKRYIEVFFFAFVPMFLLFGTPIYLAIEIIDRYIK